MEWDSHRSPVDFDFESESHSCDFLYVFETFAGEIPISTVALWDFPTWSTYSMSDRADNILFNIHTCGVLQDVSHNALIRNHSDSFPFIRYQHCARLTE